MAIRLTIENLYGGAVRERLAQELQNVLANIADINTPAKKPRTITLKLKVTPNADRNIAAVQIACTSALQPVEPLETSISMGTDIRTGELYAEEIGAGENAGQNILPGVEIRGPLTQENKPSIGFNAITKEQ